MSLSTTLIDGTGNGYKATVTARGQIVTAPIDFSSPIFREMTDTGTAYNFVAPKTGWQFVITGVVLDADRSVSGTNGALVEIYCTDSAVSTTPTIDILTLQPLKNENRTLTGLNIITDPGVWVNGHTDDATCFLTLIGYYVKEIS